MKNKRRIFFRADGNSKIGLGHVFRSLALADMLCEEFECHFIIRDPLRSLKKQILEVCSYVFELPSKAENICDEARQLINYLFNGSEIVVLDGYDFHTQYQKIIREKCFKLVCIDDIHDYHFVADAVINHAGGINPDNYSIECYTKLYLGLNYALLRKQFRRFDKRTQDLRNNNLLICLGGSDPKNETLSVLRKCEKFNEYIEKCYVVLGEPYPYHKELKQFVRNSVLSIEVLSELSPTEMVIYMEKCKRAITSPSTISYEYLSVGGELYLQLTADNQEGIHSYLLKENLAFSFEHFPVLDNAMKTEALKKQAKIFDEKIRQNFIDIFKSF